MLLHEKDDLNYCRNFDVSYTTKQADRNDHRMEKLVAQTLQ